MKFRRIILDRASSMSRMERMKLLAEYGESRGLVLSAGRMERMKLLRRMSEIRAMFGIDSAAKGDSAFLRAVIDGREDFYSASTTERLSSIAGRDADHPGIAALIQQAKTAAKAWFIAEFERKTAGVAA